MDPNQFLLLILQRYELADAFKKMKPTKDQVGGKYFCWLISLL